jgi:hypothetical protein
VDYNGISGYIGQFEVVEPWIFKSLLEDWAIMWPFSTKPSYNNFISIQSFSYKFGPIYLSMNEIANPSIREFNI